MPPRIKGAAMWDDPGRSEWHLDPEFWSANCAEHRFADGYELVAFDLPAAHGLPPQMAGDCMAHA